jgi:hypothetical protein
MVEVHVLRSLIWIFLAIEVRSYTRWCLLFRRTSLSEVNMEFRGLKTVFEGRRHFFNVGKNWSGSLIQLPPTKEESASSSSVYNVAKLITASIIHIRM